MELPPAAELTRRRPARRVVDRYLDALGLAAERARDRLARIRRAAGDAATRARCSPRCMRRSPTTRSIPTNPARASVRRARSRSPRVRGCRPRPRPGDGKALAADGAAARAHVDGAAPLAAAAAWRSSARHPRSESQHVPDSPARAWRAGVAPAVWRRSLLVLLIVGADVPRDRLHGRGPAVPRPPAARDRRSSILFAILFGWVSAGFWTAMAGFLVLARGRDRYAISRTAAQRRADRRRTRAPRSSCRSATRTSPRVFARPARDLRVARAHRRAASASISSCCPTPAIPTRASPRSAAWLELCRAVDGFGRVFYRWRQHRIKRKSGNIADFCRRWGSSYRYMVVLDADSVMSGDCLTRAGADRRSQSRRRHHPDRAARGRARHAVRAHPAVRHAASTVRCSPPACTSGSSANRTTGATTRSSASRRSSGTARSDACRARGALSGEILSHDFVEAALMRRAGWAVWIAYDLPGSYEEMPPNLIDELKRDRRWCQGNLMNFRLFLMKGLHPAHRAVFMTGVMAYLSAPLWFLFLVLSTALLAVHTLTRAGVFRRAVPAVSAVAGVASRVGADARRRDGDRCCSCPRSSRAAARRAGGARLRRRAARSSASVAARDACSRRCSRRSACCSTRSSCVTALAGRTLHVEIAAARRRARRPGAKRCAATALHTLLGVAWAAFVYWLESAVPLVAAAGRRRADRCRSRCRSTRAACVRAGARAAPGCS